MLITNCHERILPVPAAYVADLLDSLGGPDDRLWPADRWFPMRLDRRLGVGAAGGHGPVRYHCSARSSGSVEFTFDRILGSPLWRGRHRFTASPAPAGTLLRHDLQLDVPLVQWLQWHALVGPLHDAVLEDLLDRAEGTRRARWTPWVRLLRLAFPRIRGRG